MGPAFVTGNRFKHWRLSDNTVGVLVRYSMRSHESVTREGGAEENPRAKPEALECGEYAAVCVGRHL